MPKTWNDFQQLLDAVARDFTQYRLQSGKVFMWSAATQTITFNSRAKAAPCLLLHELAHAELQHSDYTLDLELIRYEVAAWQYAHQLMKRFQVDIDDNFIQDNLDSYRQWLHQRSLCPRCAQTGIQPNRNTYSCINCSYVWRVNDALHCGLKRFRLQDQDQLALPQS